MNEPVPHVKESIPEFAPPFFVYLAFLVAALAIGNNHSCSGGLGFYALLGVAGLLVLLVCPFFVSKKRGPITQFVMSVFYFLLGIAVWAGSFALGDMRFMCSLF
ncbi:hypothetical protein NHH73_03790 [Oxalobacteraceae bacterium OTU3CINTB1]|nr:hypothetical protein NHH73_03790 [Oxalobacteraceae bacterium OTU3CINTB1]